MLGKSARRCRGVKQAIISDIHSNLEGLEVVLADIQSQGISEIFCLGDVIGYGPNPRECIDKIAKNVEVCILGNHDQGALFDPEGFSSGAERAIFWTREQLETKDGDPNAAKRWDFLAELPRNYQEGNRMFVHGSPRNPLNEYVFPEDIYNTKKFEKLFALIRDVCFVGHTHIPGVFTESRRFVRPQEIGNKYVIGEEKVLINVGSVGQPRDGDPRSCYVVLDDDVVRFRRTDYPREQTIAKIYAIRELDDFLGDRLKEGQ